jgi:hypothetical protein
MCVADCDPFKAALLVLAASICGNAQERRGVQSSEGLYIEIIHQAGHRRLRAWHR